MRKGRKQAQKELRLKQESEGFCILERPSTPNRKSDFKSVEEEQEARQFAATEQARILYSQLPILLKRLSKTEDSRNPKEVKYKLTLLMIYGILMFVFQMSSRRKANKQLTRPQFMENLKMLFPDIEDIPTMIHWRVFYARLMQEK